MSTRTDFNGKTTTYAYDTLNRLLSKTPDAFFNAPPIVFTYNSVGQRASMVGKMASDCYASWRGFLKGTDQAVPVGFWLVSGCPGWFPPVAFPLSL
jgi:hypothetical protein